MNIFVLFLVHSFSKSFVIDTIGFYQFTNVTTDDNISVKFDSRSLRLFLFLPFNSNLLIDHLFADGKDITSDFHIKIEDEYGIAVDAEKLAEITFDAKSDPEANFKSNCISAWFISRDKCSKSSYFESGGLSTLISSNPSKQSIISNTKYTQYSVCAFSPIFDYTEVSYSINFGVDHSKAINITSDSCLYSKDFDKYDECVSNYDPGAKFKVSNGFFIKYTINSTSEITNSTVDDRVKMILKRYTEKSNNTDFFELLCLAQAIESCNSTGCIYDQDIENSFDYKCNTELDKYFKILLIVLLSVFAFIIIITVLCCCGCCICCGVAGCTACSCNINRNKRMNERLLNDDPESIKTISQYNNDYYTQNPATPIVYPMEQQQYIQQQYQNPIPMGNPPPYNA